MFSIKLFSIRERYVGALVTALMIASGSSLACDGILSLTRNVSVDVTSVQLAERLYKSECRGSSIKSNWNAQVGIEAIIEQIPLKLKLGGGSSKQKIEHLCSNFDQWKSDNSQYYTSAASTPIPAIDAWVACKRLEGEDVFFTAEPQRERVGFSVRRGKNIIDFYGMTYDPAKMICSGPFGNNKEQTIVDDKVRFELKEGTDYPITCSRKIFTDKVGIEYYPADTIAISAQGKAPLLIPLNRENVDQGIFLSELEKRIVLIKNEVEKLAVQKMECRTFKNISSLESRHLIEISVNVEDGYFITGGGCDLVDVQPDRWGFIRGGTITSDGKGWYCRSEPIPNFGFSRRVAASAIGCRYK